MRHGGQWHRSFVLARLEAEKVSPSPPAIVLPCSASSLDLTGLPRAGGGSRFLADDRPDAYERLVDRLLASPHYGEKWPLFGSTSPTMPTARV